MTTYFVSIDIGTTGTKAIVFDKKEISKAAGHLIRLPISHVPDMRNRRRKR